MTDHNQLKKYARRVLEKLGFEETEIEEEYSVSFEGMRERLIVDVVGISENRKVAIECGNTPSDKLIKLHMYFDEVILLPYFKTKVSDAFVGSEKNMAIKITRQEKTINKLKNQIEKLEHENKNLKENVLSLKDDRRKYSYDLRKGLGALIFHYCDLLDLFPNERIIDRYELSNFRAYMNRIFERTEVIKKISDEDLININKSVELNSISLAREKEDIKKIAEKMDKPFG